MWGGVKSQMADVTAKYIPNAGFEECEVVANNAGGAADVHADYATESGTDYETVGWKLVSQAKSANGGAVAYSTDLKVQYSKWNVAGDEGPAAGPIGGAGNKHGLCFSGNASVVYQQAEAITLPAGSYKFTIHVWARNGETSNPKPVQQVVNDKTGFMPDGGTDDNLIPAVRKSLQFKSNDWDTEVLEFELLEPTTGRFQLSYGSSYFVVIDDLTLEANDGIITTSLLTAITKAKTLNEMLQDNNLAEAVSAAEEFAANPTSQDDVPLQVEALYTAMGTALVKIEEGVVDITSAYVDNPSFETGEIAPWQWGNSAGAVSEPNNTASQPYIDGKNIAYFSLSGSNTITQTVGNLPPGFYLVSAKLSSGKIKVILGSTSTDCTGGSDPLFLRVASPAMELTGGEVAIGFKGNLAYRVDDFHLYYAKDAASLETCFLNLVKADARVLLDNPTYDVVTGKERTELVDALQGDDAAAINTKANAFFKALTDYSNFEKAKSDATSYDKDSYPYADASYLEHIATMISTVATSADQAALLASELPEVCFNCYVSNAYCQGVEHTDYTSSIMGANAAETPQGWSGKNMTVRLDQTAWTNPMTGEQDNAVYGVTSDYYRTSSTDSSVLKQTLTGLPAGKYVLSMTAMGSSGLEVVVFFNGETIGTISLSGKYGGGKYGGGWNDYVITFNKTSDADMPLQLQCRPSANYQEWYIDNFRLYLLADDADAVHAVEAMLRTHDVIYDLSGRQVAQPTKGAYIVNGKKVMIK